MPIFRVGDRVRFVGNVGDRNFGMEGTVVCFYSYSLGGLQRDLQEVNITDGSIEIGAYFPDMVPLEEGHSLDDILDTEYGGWWCTLHNIVLVEPRPPRVWPPTESHKVRYSNMETEYV